MKSQRIRVWVLRLAGLLLFLPAPLMLAYRSTAAFTATPFKDIGPRFSLMRREIALGELIQRVFFQEDQNTGKSYVDELPAPTLKTWLEGSFQRTFERWFEPRLALREPLVRTANQLYYSVFGKSYMYNGSVVAGLADEFYEQHYVQDACNTFKPPSAVEDDALVRRIAELSRRWRARGKAFAVMMAPHKAEMVPGHVPERFCSQPGRSQRRVQLISALRKAGVAVCDPEQEIRELAASTGMPAYPRGGTHWSEIGAYAAAQVLTAELGRQYGRELRLNPPTRFDLYPRPFGSDADLVALANLVFPPLDYPSPRLEFDEGAGGPLNPQRLAIVGDSFTYTLADVLERGHAFSHMTHFFYYYLARYDYPGRTPHEIAREAVNWERDFLSADALVFLANAVTFTAPQNREFFDDALSYTGGFDAASAKL
jgi:alginate O-acetyltransferase complex protein AlgJ